MRGIAALLTVLSLGACSGESEPLAQTPMTRRPFLPEVNIVGANGDGSVASVLRGTLAALRDNAYTCSTDGGTFANGDVIVGRTYTVGSGETATKIKIITKNGDLVAQRVHYTDQSVQRRLLWHGNGRPLTGADSVASEIFAAAAAAPCSAE